MEYAHGDSAAKCTQMTSQGLGEKTVSIVTQLCSQDLSADAWARLPWKGMYIIQDAVEAHELGIQQVHKPASVQLCSQISTDRQQEHAQQSAKNTIGTLGHQD